MEIDKQIHLKLTLIIRTYIVNIKVFIMGFRDKFKNALGSDKNDEDDFESKDNTGNFKHLSKLMIDSNYVSLDSDIVITSFEKRLFREGIPILKNITIDGHGHSIDAKGIKRIFLTNEKNITLKNITLKNGFADGGGAIYIGDKGSLSIKDCTFINNISKMGGAIINWGEVKLENVDFITNTAEREGGAINNQNGGKISCIDCSFKQNKALEIGGAITNFESMTITESTFEKNASNKNGGAILNTANGNLDISKTNFIKNTASGEGGALNNNSSSSNLKVNECKFIDNRSDKVGGAIINWGNSNIQNSEFRGNFSKIKGHDIYQKGNLELLNVNFNNIKEKSISVTNEELVKIENCEFIEYDD